MAGMDRYPYFDGKDYVWKRRLEISSDTTQPSNPPRLTDHANENIATEEDADDAVRKYVGLGVGLVSLITENLLSHPFVVLRRQCQVHNNSIRNHLIPVTLLPVIVHLHRRQGITTLWKGLGSVLMVRGMTLAVEDLLTKLTPWPKEVSWPCSLKAVGQHILLKCASFAIITPFYSASLVETVQSDIASEKPGIFDVFKEGICRLLSWSAPQKGRMLPIWTLVVPTVIYGLFKYLMMLSVRGCARRAIVASHRRDQQRQGALSRDSIVPVNPDADLNSTLIAFFTTEIVFYPFETILHRLHLQGTRTIIDNLDSGYEVTPILTSYEGARDCYDITLQEEGVAGLYKGFGALLLQFAAHIAVVKLTKVVLTEVTNLLRSGPKTGCASQTQIAGATRVSSSNLGSSASGIESPIGYDYPSQSYS